MNNQPPPFTFTPFADVGTTEPFVARLALGLPELLDGTLYQNREEIKESILRSCLECLIPACVSLRELRKIADKPDAPLLNKTKYFDDMCKCLWSAYKDRMQGAAKLMDYGIGFAFEKDSKFEQGCVDFSNAHPEISPVLTAEFRPAERLGKKICHDSEMSTLSTKRLRGHRSVLFSPTSRVAFPQCLPSDRGNLGHSHRSETTSGSDSARDS